MDDTLSSFLVRCTDQHSAPYTQGGRRRRN